MNDEVFKLYEEIIYVLDSKQKSIFKLGFDLGISEGTAQCIKKIEKLK